jgi:hypothetical protein
MKHGEKRVSLCVRFFTFSLLIIGLIIMNFKPAFADDPYISAKANRAGLGHYTAGLLSSSMKTSTGSFGSNEYESIFEQPPITLSDGYWYSFTSDRSSGFLCTDDFGELNQWIGDIHWFGATGIYNEQDDQWDVGSPNGMHFEIKFYSNNVGFPGVNIATFTDIIPTIENYDTFDGVQMYRFNVIFNSPFFLKNGWVSIQSISSPTNSQFLWLISPTGNKNAMQNGETIVLGDNGDNVNLSFILTRAKLVPGISLSGSLFLIIIFPFVILWAAYRRPRLFKRKTFIE